MKYILQLQTVWLSLDVIIDNVVIRHLQVHCFIFSLVLKMLFNVYFLNFSLFLHL